MKIENVTGALIAAIILFVTGFVAILQLPEIDSWRDITSSVWLVLSSGALLSFLKDYQALWSRRTIAKLTGTGST